eukprot:3347014-Amphidinium_carterae.1
MQPAYGPFTKLQQSGWRKSLFLAPPRAYSKTIPMFTCTRTLVKAYTTEHCAAPSSCLARPDNQTSLRKDCSSA